MHLCKTAQLGGVQGLECTHCQKRCCIRHSFRHRFQKRDHKISKGKKTSAKELEAYSPTGVGDGKEAFGGEAGALVQVQHLQHGARRGRREELEVRVQHRHTPQLQSVQVFPERSQAELPQPRLRVAAPVAPQQVVLGSARLALEPQRAACP